MLYDNSLLMGAPPHKAILPGVRPIWVATYGCGEYPEYVLQAPVTGQPVTGHSSSASLGTGLPGTSQPRKFISSHPGTVLPGSGQPVAGQPVTGQPVTGQPDTGQLITSDPIPVTSHQVPVTSHLGTDHYARLLVTGYQSPGTSHRAPGTSQFNGYWSSNNSNWFEHRVAIYIKGILCSHYRMSLRILDILNYH